MPSIAELRKKIRGITSTRKITKAMKMVAGAKFSRAARQGNDALRYAAEMETVLHGLLASAPPPLGRHASFYRTPGLPAPVGGRVGIIVVAADKGLCGDFNNAILRQADALLRHHGTNVRVLFSIGRKATDHFQATAVPRMVPHAQVFKLLDFATAEAIGGQALEIFAQEKIGEYLVVHSHFSSMVKQEVAVTRLLPVSAPAGTLPAFQGALLEPGNEGDLLAELVPQYVKAKIYGILRDNYTAELAARMRAMDNATRNAGELIDTITLEMNKVRQSVITREIAEIISTSEVVK